MRTGAPISSTRLTGLDRKTRLQVADAPRNNGCADIGREGYVSEQFHPAAPHHLPFFITGPNEADGLLVFTGLFLLAAIFSIGILYWKLHSLPERMAHKSQKLQFEIVAVLGLISLFTHMHIFWIAGLLLALIDLPDFGTPLRSIAGSVEKIAGAAPESDAPAAPLAPGANGADSKGPAASKEEVKGHA
jgi:hypothetical protein